MSKICLISPSLHLGGIERVMTMLANYYAEQGHHVMFIACLPGNHFYELNEQIEFAEPKKYNGFLGKILRYPRLLFFIRREVRKYKPETVMVFGDYFSPITVMALTGTGYPVFIADQMSPTYNFPQHIKLLKKIFYPCATGLIAQTPLAESYYKRRYGKEKNSRVIANPMNLPPNIRIQRKKYVTVVARMHHHKGIDTALEVWSRVKEKNGWKMVFAGGGVLLKEMKDYALKLGINDDAIFLGNVSNVYGLLAESGIFVLSSRGEGFPNALCEAMASGLPCICFEKLNNPMIITKDGFDGVLVPNDNKDLMAQKLTELIADEKQRDRLAAQARKITERLNIDIIAPQFLDFILSK